MAAHRQPACLQIGSVALGLNLLTRLTTALDLIGIGIFLLLVIWFERSSVSDSASLVWRKFVDYCKVAVPVYAVFVLIDRVYQWHRFGSFFDTYVSVYAQEYKRMYPNLPAKYPWETPFHVGFLGPLITPEKSIFLFDPLLILTLLIAGLAWKRFRSVLPIEGDRTVLPARVPPGGISDVNCEGHCSADGPEVAP